MILAIDTETTGTDTFHGCKPFLVTACNGSQNFWWQGQVNPYNREVIWDDEDIEDMYLFFQSAEVLIFHNAQFDIRMLESIGVPITNLWPKIQDTLVAAHCVNSAHETYADKAMGKKSPVGRSLGLKPLTLEYYGYPADDEEELEHAVKAARLAAPHEYQIAKQGHPHFPALDKQKWFKMDYWLAPEECLYYGLGDVERTYLLWIAFKPAMVSDNVWSVYKKRMSLLRNCYYMTVEGEDFDVESATAYIETLKKDMEGLRQEMKAMFNIKWAFKPSKPSHIASIIGSNLNFKPHQLIRTKDDKVSTNKNSVAKYQALNPHPFFEALKTWKTAEARLRYISTYVNWVASDGCIHSNYNPTGTRETRQSSSAPNGQNRTGALDRFFFPQKGWVWWDADFDNIEMRIWAYAVGNQELVELFNQDKSYHMFVFDTLFPEESKRYSQIKNKAKGEMTELELSLAKRYRNIKEFNFGIIYGATEGKADETVNKVGAYKRLIERLPEIATFNDSLIAQVYRNADKHMFPYVETLGGYHLPVPITEPYKAANYYVQGSAGDITRDAMEMIASNEDYIDSGSRMYNQTHDSIRVKIPICNETGYLIDLYTKLMKQAGEQYIPSCSVTYNIISPPNDPWPF